jgi:hypothetical protein
MKVISHPISLFIACLQEKSQHFHYEIYTLVLFFLIIHMFANKANIYHEQEAALLVEELVDKEGDAEFEKAKERCFVEESDKMVVDMFESPFEDYVLFSERKKFANAPMAYMDG